ncbi:ABC transporter permease [Seonamhaeicola sp. ML3]|uniref:ABC transporter permease n=1 Tax=Seonamhaeicola sp. ML3 TaxID=2937786 RepID=UPI00200CACF1|nr:ABC transporter permease [Seonamhaeicola sp. ML3]
MSIWKISLLNLKSKPLYTFLSVFTLALSIVLLLGIKQIKTSFNHQIDNNLAGIDMVVGAKGSPLQLVFASVLHLDNPTGNISYKEAKNISKNPFVKKAIPISYGDNYKGYRIVGTTKAFRHLYESELVTGQDFKKPMEVILGHHIAQTTKLAIGDTFLSSHGLVESDIEVHNEKFTVVGILKPTQKVIDRLIICDLESIWNVHDHDEHDNDEGHVLDSHDEHDEGHEHEEHDEHYHENKGEELDGHDHKEHDEHHDDTENEVTSLLLTFSNPTAFLTLPRTINESTNMQAALPKLELEKLYNFLGIGLNAISWIAYLILVIAALTIFISLYKMAKERAFDLALLRTYGATHYQVIKIVAYEGLLIILSAFLIGVLIVKIALPLILENLDTGLNNNLLQNLPFQDILQIGILVFVITLLSIILAVYPIMKMKISEVLRDEK